MFCCYCNFCLGFSGVTSSFSVVQDLFIYNVQAEYFFYFFSSPIFGAPAVLRLVCIRMVMLLFTLKTLFWCLLVAYARFGLHLEGMLRIAVVAYLEILFGHLRGMA